MLPKIQNILYATDLSQTARHALGYAASLAGQYDAQLTVMHILPDSLELLSEESGMDLAETFGETAARWIDQGDVQQAITAIQERLKQEAREDFASTPAADAVAKATITVRCGEAAERIVEETKKGLIDLVIMGTHGRSGLLHLMLGSVAKETIKRTNVPVLVVPLPD